MRFTKEHTDDVETLFEVLREHVIDKFGVDVKDLEEVKNNSRKKPFVYFRKMMMLILGDKFLSGYTQDEISSVVGLDRTSYIYHFKVHVNWYGRYQEYKQDYDLIKEKFDIKLSKSDN